MRALMMAPRALPHGAPPADSLDRACRTDQGIACQIIWDVSHNAHAASLAGPIQVAGRVVFVLLLALLVRLAARRLINRVTSRATLSRQNGGHVSHSLLGDRRQQRASALGSVLGNAASVTIFTIAVFIMLGDLGLNLAPVLASAGVLGIAIGFGAQNLVQDFLAGIFILLEDQYGVGDVIDVVGVSGTVEAVSLRLTRVRDVNGVIWHVRNGTISKSGNESHGWARAVVDFPVPYDLDIVEVRALLEHTAVAMWQDPAWRDVILERPEVWGVQEVTSESVLVRVIARTAPLRQWEVGRELRELLKVALAGLHPTAGTTSLPGGGASPGGTGGPSASSGADASADDPSTSSASPSPSNLAAGESHAGDGQGAASPARHPGADGSGTGD
jgi:small-conductance mechanosensitive channel